MSALGAAGPSHLRAQTAIGPSVPRRRESVALGVGAFFALAAFASLEYSTLLLHPPALRLLGACAAASACGALLAASSRVRPAAAGPRAAAALRAAIGVLIMLVALLAGLLAIGIPAHLLAPAGWGQLASDVRRGYDGLEGWLWPFRGSQRWSRLTVLLLVPPTLTLAAGLRFWPTRRAQRARALGALALLVTILLAGVVNQTAPAWRVQGVALLALLACWLWLPSLGALAINRAAAWLLACAFAALALAPVLAARTPWLDYRAWDPLPASTTFQWDQLYGPISWSRSSATIATVAEPRPGLLRVTALDRFDGVRFLRSDAPPGAAALDLAGARRGSAGTAAAMRVATVTLSGLRSTLLTSGGGLATGLRWLRGASPAVSRSADGTVTFARAPSDGTRYRVRSYSPQPPAAVLRAAPRAFPPAYLAYARLELPGARASGLRTPDLGAEASARVPVSALVGAPAPGRTPASDPAMAARIERSPYGPMFALAGRLAAGRRSPYDVALATQRYLLARYPYSEHPPRARYPLESFLFGSAGGYCQQFSGAMALMLRMDGIPARVAAGFRPIAFDAASGAWEVRPIDAHAWVEVYFAGVGWVPFDPTPPRSSSAAPPLGSALGATPRPVGSGGAPSAHAHGRAAAPVPARRAGAGAGARGWLWPALAIALAAALAALLTRAWLRGARRLRAGLRGDGAGAVAELRAAYARSGRPLPATITLARLQARLEASGERAGARYVELLRRARYASAARPAARPTARDRRELRRALAAGGGPRARLRALLALPPGVARKA